MKKCLVVLVICFSILNTYAQENAVSFGGLNEEYINSICTKSDGSIYVAGGFKTPTLDLGNGIVLTNSGTGADAFIARYNSNGECVSATALIGLKSDYINDMVIDSDNNIYIVGYYFSASLDMGNGQQAKNIGGADAYLAKYNSDAICQWVVNIGNYDYEYANKLVIDNSNNIYVCGEFASYMLIFSPQDTLFNTGSSTFFRSYDGYIAKYNSSGTYIKCENISGLINEWIKDITLDKLGNLLICGVYTSPTLPLANGVILENNSNSGFCDGFIANYTTDLVLNNAYSVGGTDNDAINSISPDNDGNLIISGWYKSNTLNINDELILNNVVNNDYNGFLVKFNTSYQTQWAENLGGASYDFVNDLLIDKNGYIFISGNFASSKLRPDDTLVLNNRGKDDAYISKYTGDGKCLWTYDIGGANNEKINSMCIDKDNSLYAAGSFVSPTITMNNITLTNAGSNDAFFVKFKDNTNQTLVYPDDKSFSHYLEKFIWNYCAGANSYTLQIALDGLFTNIFHEKSYTDSSTTDYPELPFNMYYWRVIAQFNNDTISISEIRSFQIGGDAVELATDEYVNIFPNPSAEKFNIDVNLNSNSETIINIFNSIGRVENTYIVASNRSNQAINTDGLASGIYYIEIISKNRYLRYPIVISK